MQKYVVKKKVKWVPFMCSRNAANAVKYTTTIEPLSLLRVVMLFQLGIPFTSIVGKYGLTALKSSLYGD